MHFFRIETESTIWNLHYDQTEYFYTIWIPICV